ncbi:hypothetical protein IRJ41_002398 [Triplophysa rosa]|uniref:C2H2-type domain-containing protein n=1 Tax=Triplophysa rosa TaxID=992332 RepID=A0A9W7WZF2_TRIRA|nr:hypothetical protein IRJ41_002398 [Triplophysa rosa]
MGYICFKCKKTVGANVRFLFSHLRRMHNVHSSSSYFECGQAGCHRTFNHSRSFERHLLQHHVEAEEEEPSQPLTSHSQTFEEEDNAAENNMADDMEWDELEQITITERVALYLSKLRAKSSMALSTVSFLVQQTSSLGALQRQTMSFLQRIGQIGYLVQPVEQPLPGVSYTQQRDSQTGTVKQVAVQDTSQRIPLRPLMKLILETPGTVEKIMDSVHPTEPSVPLLLYNDDCEKVNPLDSKTSIHKLGFIYFTLKCLPPECLSSLNFHFLLAVYKSEDAKTYGIDAVLKSVVDDINDLETAHFKGTLKVWVPKFCHVKKQLMRTQTMEDPSLLRNKDGHLSDLLQSNPTETGLKRQSILNNPKYFHETENVAHNIMHDILEGVGAYEIKLVLGSLISQKAITLDQVNYRITSYDYGFCDSAQMWCLLRLLPLMIGDLIPEGNKYWELLLLLLTCMENLYSPPLTEDAVLFLRHLIVEHHSLFLKLFPDRHLKPKHHFMLHYAGAIRRLGPLVHYWSMRFEAKQVFFKRLAHMTCNFRNVCKTMAFRHQMLLKLVLVTLVHLLPLRGFDQVCHRFENSPLTDVYIPSWVKWKGSEYHPGMTLLVSYSTW